MNKIFIHEFHNICIRQIALVIETELNFSFSDITHTHTRIKARLNNGFTYFFFCMLITESVTTFFFYPIYFHFSKP